MINFNRNSIVRTNIYKLLINYQDLRSLAIETFENIDIAQAGSLKL